MKKNIALVIDQPGWCFDNIAQEVAGRLAGKYEFTIMPVAEAEGSFDVVVSFWYGALPTLAARMTRGVGVCCVYDGYSWTQPGGEQQLREALRYADVVGAANEALVPTLSTMTTQPVMLIEDGVNLDLFRIYTEPSEFIVGWCGNSAASGECMGNPDADIKGIGMIREACRRCGIALKVLDVSQGERVSHQEMVYWYNQIALYVCASKVEGTPNPPLEALACGRPVVTTAVGVLPKVMGATNGMVVGRSTDEIAQALAAMRGRWEMNGKRWGAAKLQANRNSVAHFSWNKKIEGWDKLLEAACSM